MNYNINFQIAALIIVILLLYHFLTQKKLYNINARTFTYVLVLGGLYILLDLLSTLVFMNYRAEYETAILLAITIAYLFDVMLPYILYCCVCIISGEKQRKIGGTSAVCTAITVVLLLLIMGNIKSGWFFYFDESGTFVTGSGYIFLYIYALAYAVLVIVSAIRNRGENITRKMGIVGEFLVLEGVCMVIQMYTQRLLLTGFGLALGLVFLYLTINNPGDYVDSITGVFDKQYFDKSDRGKTGQEGRVSSDRNRVLYAETGE